MYKFQCDRCICCICFCATDCIFVSVRSLHLLQSLYLLLCNCCVSVSVVQLLHLFQCDGCVVPSPYLLSAIEVTFQPLYSFREITTYADPVPFLHPSPCYDSFSVFVSVKNSYANIGITVPYFLRKWARIIDICTLYYTCIKNEKYSQITAMRYNFFASIYSLLFRQTCNNYKIHSKTIPIAQRFLCFTL